MNPIETQIRALEARLCAAQLRSDVAELDALLHNNLLFVGPNGELATKAMDLEAHQSGAVHFLEVTPRDLELRISTSETVVALAKVFLRLEVGGALVEGDYRYLRVWKNGENGWQIIAGSVGAIT